MKQNTFKPRGGAIIILCIAVAALWLTAVYGIYEDSQREKYSAAIKPGEVVYGTHSSAVVPMIVTTTRPSSTVPMVSASAVRSYAHHGHATMPTTAASGNGIHTTSSAKVKTVGSGGGGAGAGMTTSGSSASSQRGIVYGNPTISMPMIAMNSARSSAFSAQAAENATSPYSGVGPRRVHDNGNGGVDGDYNGEAWQDGDTWYIWDMSEGEWRDPEDYDSRTDSYGNTYEYRDGEWVWVSGPGDPGVPVGATPWLLMMALGAIYAVRKWVRGKEKRASRIVAMSFCEPRSCRPTLSS